MATIKFNGIDFGSQIIDNELRIGVLERIIEVFVHKFPLIGAPISPTEMEEIRLSVANDLRQKYPTSDIILKPLKPRV
jgi:hypothetical protein